MFLEKIQEFFYRAAFCWFQSHDTDYEYSKFLEEQIDEHGIKQIDPYIALVGGNFIWIRNYPYAFGTIEYTGPDNIRFLDKLPTMKLRRKIRKMIGEM